MGKQFRVELHNITPAGSEIRATLDMPATRSDYHDAVQKARIEDTRRCRNEVTQVYRDDLSPTLIGRDLDLLELNLFALRLDKLTAAESQGFAELIKAEEKKSTGPVPLSRLINLTLNTNTVGELRDIYVPHEMDCFDCMSGAPVVLEVTKGFFNDPDYDNDVSVWLGLPAHEKTIQAAVEKVEAASIEECAFRCVECKIPAVCEWLNDAMDDKGGIAPAQQYAKMLEKKLRVWDEDDIVQYKAMLEATSCRDLDGATDLANRLDEYQLNRDISSPKDAAVEELRTVLDEVSVELLTPHVNLEAYGAALLDHYNGTLTSYGRLERQDRQPIQHISKQHVQEGVMTFG